MGKTEKLGWSSCAILSVGLRDGLDDEPVNHATGDTYVEKMQLIVGAANRLGEEENISLQPGDLGGRILETNAGTGHVCELAVGFLGEAYSRKD